MFHKEDSSVLSNNKRSVDVALRKSDRRTLRNIAGRIILPTTCCTDNDNDNDSNGSPSKAAELLDAIFLEGTLVQRKIVLPKKSGGKVQLYFRSPSSHDDDNNDKSLWPYRTTTQCVWMSLDAAGPNQPLEVVHAPTVALLAVLPAFLPTVEVPWQVSKFTCRGAHLMRAGMRSVPPPPVEATTTTYCCNSIVAIQVHGNPQPFGVGRLTENTTSQTIGMDGKGVGVNVWTCYGDDLWKQQASHQMSTEGIVSPFGGACYDNGHYGNVGFLEGKVVKPIIAVDDGDDDSEEEEEESDEPDECDGRASLTASENVEDGVPSSQPQQEIGTDGKDSSNRSTRAVSDDGEKDSDANVQEDNPHDVVLHQAFCRALVNIKDSELPITTANFYAQHVIPHRPPDATIELKLTTWKKFGTYLEQQQQVDCGLVTVMPHGTNPMGYLTGINREHVDLRNCKKDKASKTQTAKLQVVNLYIIPHHFCSKLRLDEDAVKAVNAKSDQRRGTGMLTIPEARAILEQYVTDNELNVPSGEKVRLDGALTDLFYKKQHAPPETLSRKDLYQKWIDKMEPAYALVEMPGNRITKSGRGTVPRVSMEVSLRQGRKFITRLRGLEDFDVDPVAFAKDVSKRFACSGAVETTAVGREALKRGHVELVFQGHLVEELRALLLGDDRLTSHGGAKKSDLCLPKTVIDVVLKKGVPAKKPK